jgi:hypothetical protein
MKKMLTLSSHFFASLSKLNTKGVLKGGAIYEPIPPQAREAKETEIKTK